MLGRTHATSAVVLALAGVPFLNHVALPWLHLAPITGWAVPVLAVSAAGGAMLPDLDHRDATIAHSLGAVTRGLAVGGGAVSGGHRHGTHSLLGVAVFTVAAWGLARAGGWPLGIWLGFLFAIALTALQIPLVRNVWIHTLLCLSIGAGFVLLATQITLPALATVMGVSIGAVAHLLGDMLTIEGCPLLWPFTKTRFHVLSLTTGHFTERVIVGPLLGVVAVVQTLALAGLLPVLTGAFRQLAG